MVADDIYECRIQGDVCPPTLKCLKQEDGAYTCRCEKKGYVVKGDGQERTCEGMCLVSFKLFSHTTMPFLRFYDSLRKQPSGHLATLLLVSRQKKWRLRNKSRNFILMKCHYPDLGSASDWLNHVFPRGTTNQKHHPDLGSDASSVWNFWAGFSDVIWRGIQWERRQMSNFMIVTPFYPRNRVNFVTG